MIVSRETSLLSQYAALLRKWNPAINLIAPSTLSDIEGRHIADSAQLANLAQGTAGDWADLGSGGGLPGLVIAIQCPTKQVTLVESDGRKCSFLRTSVRELGLDNVRICNSRIEAADRLNVASVSARALAPLPLLLSYASRHLAPAGTAWLMKGRNWRSEIDEAATDWRFDYVAHPSKTDPDAAILEITGLRHA